MPITVQLRWTHATAMTGATYLLGHMHGGCAMATNDNDTVERARGDRFTSILVPVDGSPESLAVIDYAARLKADRILVMRVEVDEPAELTEENDAYTRWHREHLEAVARELEDEARAHADAADMVEYTIRYGNPAERIMAEAGDHDLIAMSSSGKGAAGRILFGSVTDRVVRFGTTPTLVLRASREKVAAGPPERIVVPLDGSELAEQAIPVACRVARAASLPVHLVRAVGMDEVLQTVREMRGDTKGSIYTIGDDPYEVGRERAYDVALSYLKAVRDRLDGEGLTVTIDVLGGTPSFELMETVNPTDLVVMTSRGKGGIQRWLLGSVSEKLIREAKAPVLLVPVGRTGREGTEVAR